MERRKAITTAAAASLTLLAGAAGMSLSSNLVGAGANDGVGQLSPISSVTSPPITVFVDEESDPTVTVASLLPVQPTAAPSVQSTDASPVTTSSASAYSDDDDHEESDDDHDEDDDRDESEDDLHDEDEDEDHEYEGGEDDD